MHVNSGNEAVIRSNPEWNGSKTANARSTFHRHLRSCSQIERCISSIDAAVHIHALLFPQKERGHRTIVLDAGQDCLLTDLVFIFVMDFVNHQGPNQFLFLCLTRCRPHVVGVLPPGVLDLQRSRLLRMQPDE